VASQPDSSKPPMNQICRFWHSVRSCELITRGLLQLQRPTFEFPRLRLSALLLPKCGIAPNGIEPERIPDQQNQTLRQVRRQCHPTPSMPKPISTAHMHFPVLQTFWPILWLRSANIFHQPNRSESNLPRPPENLPTRAPLYHRAWRMPLWDPPTGKSISQLLPTRERKLADRCTSA